MGTRRHKERSKQGAARLSPGPFIKPRSRGRGRRPPTCRRAAALGLCEWSAAAPSLSVRPPARPPQRAPRTTRVAAPRRGVAGLRVRKIARQAAGLTEAGARVQPSLPPCFPTKPCRPPPPRSGEGNLAPPGRQGLGPPPPRLVERVHPAIFFKCDSADVSLCISVINFHLKPLNQLYSFPRNVGRP